MGGGHYDYISRSTRTESYSSMSRDAIFKSESRYTKKVTQDVDIKGKIRTCHDMDEHPAAYPIIIALDVTGSMGHVPERLVKRDFPEVMKKIIDAGVKDPQVCFVAVGDHECDSVPLQVGQFEASDELLDNWLTRLYLEGGGGSNPGESYLLAWYFAARHTETHAWEKRRQKGVLITIGDEPNLKKIPQEDIKKIFGSGQGPVTDKQILDEASEKWEVFHINLMDYSGRNRTTQDYWKQTLKDNLINTQTSDGDDIVDIISKLVIDVYNRETAGHDEEEDAPGDAPAPSGDNDGDPMLTMAALMMMQQQMNAGKAAEGTAKE